MIDAIIALITTRVDLQRLHYLSVFNFILHQALTASLTKALIATYAQLCVTTASLSVCDNLHPVYTTTLSVSTLRPSTQHLCVCALKHELHLNTTGIEGQLNHLTLLDSTSE